MLKKILKYVGIALAVLAGLPLIVAPLVYTVKVANVGEGEAFGLFGDMEGMDLTIKDFNPFWIHAMQVLTIIALIVAVVMLVVALLNDLKVSKLQSVEKILAVVVMAVGFITLVTLLINQFVNSHYETTQVFGKDVTSGAGLVAGVMGWLAPVFAIIGGILAFITVEAKKTSKKRK